MCNIVFNYGIMKWIMLIFTWEILSNSAIILDVQNIRYNFF